MKPVTSQPQVGTTDLFAFVGVRAIIGDPYGKLMQDEVAERTQKLVNVLRETVGAMDALKLIDTLPGMTAPERKIDPGPALDIRFIHEACGFKGLPAVHGA